MIHPPGDTGIARCDEGIALILIAESPKQVIKSVIYLGYPGPELNSIVEPGGIKPAVAVDEPASGINIEPVLPQKVHGIFVDRDRRDGWKGKRYFEDIQRWVDQAGRVGVRGLRVLRSLSQGGKSS